MGNRNLFFMCSIKSAFGKQTGRYTCTAVEKTNAGSPLLSGVYTAGNFKQSRDYTLAAFSQQEDNDANKQKMK